MAVDRPFAAEHNIWVNLDYDEEGGRIVRPMKAFLLRSRVAYAVTATPALNHNILNDFWNGIVYDDAANPPVIRATVNKAPVVFSRETIREVLQLGEVAQETGPRVFPTRFLWGAAKRMGYNGPTRGQQMLKSYLIGQWRFLFHVIVKVFGNKKAGFDDMSPELMSIMMSLVYNKPFSISGYIFDSFVGQVNGNARASSFQIYPRFTMLLIRHCIPNFPNVAATKTVTTMSTRGYKLMWTHSVKKAGVAKPEEGDLFGAVVDQAYVPLPNNGWMDTEAAQADAEVAVPHVNEKQAPAQ